MSDDDAFDQRLIKSAQAYARLYPSIGPRLKAAYDSGHPAARQAASAIAAAQRRAEGARETVLRDRYGLSAKEAQVVLHLTEGGAVSSCAEALGVAESTIRSHLKAIFRKTGANRQAELFALVG
ncbi:MULTISPECIES: helix-turn-helix transcriptional regulator [Phenylobacterium]|uniref:DNA-binding CsgD family transcriptional regulator n=1 Tax=Phenylobacterium koreense TaxID=266125 RepID=A0ABV2EL76_9CAUL